jgi:hypothetical protein
MTSASFLDQQRADMMDALYKRSGRDQLPYGHPLRSTYTGLWEEFCRDLAANFRDTSYPELVALVMHGIDGTQSVMTEPAARAAIAVCRAQLLGEKWA